MLAFLNGIVSNLEPSRIDRYRIRKKQNIILNYLARFSRLLGRLASQSPLLSLSPAGNSVFSTFRNIY